MAISAEIFPSMVRGTGAGISAAFGKLGATIGSYAFSEMTLRCIRWGNERRRAVWCNWDHKKTEWRYGRMVKVMEEDGLVRGLSGMPLGKWSRL